jgi:hypothetical protein
MKKIIFLFVCCISICFANPSSPNKNIQLVKNMFTEFAEGLDINKLEIYYSKDFILESNGKSYSYEEYKNLEQQIYQKLKSLKVTHYHDIFACNNKVVARMSIKLNFKQGDTHEFMVYLIASIKDNKISRLWELTYPAWSEQITPKLKP